MSQEIQGYCGKLNQRIEGFSLVSWLAERYRPQLVKKIRRAEILLEEEVLKKMSETESAKYDVLMKKEDYKKRLRKNNHTVEAHAQIIESRTKLLEEEKIESIIATNREELLEELVKIILTA